MGDHLHSQGSTVASPPTTRLPIDLAEEAAQVSRVAVARALRLLQTRTPRQTIAEAVAEANEQLLAPRRARSRSRRDGR